MAHTFKDNHSKYLAPHAREAYARARRDRQYALHVGFYDVQQEVLDADDISAKHARNVLDGRSE